MTVLSVCSQNDVNMVHLTPVKCTSYEVYTSCEVGSRLDTTSSTMKTKKIPQGLLNILDFGVTTKLYTLISLVITI